MGCIRRRFVALSLVLVLSPLAVHGVWARVQAQESAAPINPARIHEGTCSNQGRVVYPLADVVLGASPEGAVSTPQAVGVPSGIPMAVSVTTVAATFDALLAAPHSITIAETAEPNAPLIACGDIGGLRTGNDLVIGLMSMSGSGQTGSAWLRGLNDVATTVTIFSAPGLFDPAAPLSTATLPPQPTQAAEASPAAVTPPAATGTGGTEQVLNVQMEDFKFVPNALTIPANPPVKFVFRNTGLALHNFSIDALKTSTNVPSGTTAETTITAPPGTYQFYCDQPGHKAMGMFGTLTVT